MLTNFRESSKSRDLWAKVGTDTRALKDHMQPLLQSWLLAGIQGKHAPILLYHAV